PPGRSKIRLDFVLPESNVYLVGAVTITNDELTTLLSKIRDRLFQIALNSPADTTEIEPTIFQNNLRELVQLGNHAKQLLCDFGKSGSEASLRRIEAILRNKLSSRSIVQIAIDGTASDFQFPWSMLFCGANWRTANVSEFWGYRFVIEEKPAWL